MVISLGGLIIGVWYLVLLLVVARIFLRENRTPASRIAWIFVVVTLPYLGVLIYVLFGEVNMGRKYNMRLEKTGRKLFRAFGGKEGGDWQKSQKSLRNKNFFNVFSYSCSITPLEPTTGNTGELLPSAEETISRLIEDIDNAKSSFHGLYYIWFDDDTGTAFADALIRAAARGVKCRVLADAMGSRHLINSDLWQRMLDGGVDVRVALPMKGIIQGILTSRFDLRNHRKITVIDNQITYIGSRNMTDPEFRTKPKYAPWVDIMVRMEGPVVQQNNLLFMSDWMMVSDEPISELFDPVKPLSSADGFVANIVPDGPNFRVDAIPQLYENIFAAARKEIVITTPYFVPNEGLVDAICAAGYAGMKVIMILPKNNDSFVVGATSKSYYKELLNAGVVLYEYPKGLLHSKIVTIDGELAMIGSSNLDRRSFDLNYENNVLFEDKKLATAIRNRQQDYIDDSEAVDIADVLNWPTWRRLWNNAMAMLSPIL